MIDSDEEEYEAQNATFLAALDAKCPSEALAAKVFLASEESSHSWEELVINIASAKMLHLPEEDIYEPTRIWEWLAGHAVQGINAFKLCCHVITMKEPAAVVIGDSGAAPTLISQKFLENLQASKPKRRGGAKLKLIQLTGSVKCSEYVKLDLYFQSQLGPVCFKRVEAYVVKDMEANLIVEDMQLAWQLHTIREEGRKHWKIRSSLHCIPTIPGLMPMETFTASWVSYDIQPIKNRVKKLGNKRSTRWNVNALWQLTILLEAIATISAVAKGTLGKTALYLKGISLKQGSDGFIQVPNSLVELDSNYSFQVKIANTTKGKIIVWQGELLGHLFRADEALKTKADLTELEMNAFITRVTNLATLISMLNTRFNTVTATQTLSYENLKEIGPLAAEGVEPTDTEHLGRGPKTADPGPDQIYPSAKLREVIDVDLSLEPTQCESLYKVVEKNQAAFRFDGWLGHLRSEVHIKLMPGTKPISMAPYYVSPAKREAINKQIDLWLLAITRGDWRKQKSMGSPNHHSLPNRQT